MGGLGFITSYADLLVDKEANETAAEFIREKIEVRRHSRAVPQAVP